MPTTGRSGYTLEAAIRKRSEEHTSEVQSPDHLVCRLLLEKKNIGRARLGPHTGLRDDGPAATGGEPLPHSRRWAGVLRLADLRTGGAGLRALGLTLALRFLLRALLVRLASSLEAVVASAAHRSPMPTSYYSRTQSGPAKTRVLTRLAEGLAPFDPDRPWGPSSRGIQGHAKGDRAPRGRRLQKQRRCPDQSVHRGVA